jgi:hypothetical protein
MMLFFNSEEVVLDSFLVLKLLGQFGHLFLLYLRDGYMRRATGTGIRPTGATRGRAITAIRARGRRGWGWMC